jgi:exosortase/archaeosortase family protein
MACLVAYQAEGWKRRVLVLLSAAPLAIAANIVRVVILVVVVAWTGIEVLETWIHPATGILTFVLALPPIFWLGTPAAGSASRIAAASGDSASHLTPPAVPSPPPVRTS